MYLKKGEAAPYFSAADQNSNIHTLGDYQGKWLILFFYPKDNTPGCTKEACGIRDLYKRLSKYCILMGVSTDSTTSHNNFMQKHSLPFNLLSDPDKEMVRSYKVFGPKKFMGREYSGIHRATYIINPQGKIEKVYSKVKPADHAQELLDDITILTSSDHES